MTKKKESIEALVRKGNPLAALGFALDETAGSEIDCI
jgi:hypothetical protein